MDKSSITWTKGSDWWLSRTTMDGKERYPKQIRVGDLDRARVYYPVDRDALMELADEMERMPQCELCPAEIVDCSAHPDGCPDALLDHYARRIREALGVSDDA